MNGKYYKNSIKIILSSKNINDFFFNILKKEKSVTNTILDLVHEECNYVKLDRKLRDILIKMNNPKDKYQNTNNILVQFIK